MDVGSRIDGFVAHVATFRPIEVLDIRELKRTIPNITFRCKDLMDKGFDLIDICDSVSCLHALEHFGLGRYGDRIDVNGHLKGFENIGKMLQRGGKFYLSVPVGAQRIEFNGHRVFSVAYLLNMFEGKFKVDAFSYVNDAGDLTPNVHLTEDSIRNDFSCRLGCGIFEPTKL